MNASPALPDGDGTRLAVHAAPRAARSEIVGRHGDAIRVRLNAPPVDGKANRALLEFLAETLRVPLRTLTLLSGDTGRRKCVHVQGLSPEETLRRLGVPPVGPGGADAGIPAEVSAGQKGLGTRARVWQNARGE